jgi:hypothetical protein
MSTSTEADTRDEQRALTAHKLLNAVSVVQTCVEVLNDPERHIDAADRSHLTHLALEKLELIKTVLIREVHGHAGPDGD